MEKRERKVELFTGVYRSNREGRSRKSAEPLDAGVSMRKNLSVQLIEVIEQTVQEKRQTLRKERTQSSGSTAACSHDGRVALSHEFGVFVVREEPFLLGENGLFAK